MANDLSKSKTDYLKRYLEDEKKSKRKKKPKLSSALASRIKIVDRNIEIKAIKFGNEGDEDVDDDEAPVVAEIIDERSIEVKTKEVYEASRWKKFDSTSDYDASHSITDDKTKDLGNKLSTSVTKKSTKSASTENCNAYDDDCSPARKPQNASSKSRLDSDSDFSPPRSHLMRQNQNPSRTRHDSDSDCSPPRSRQEPMETKRRYDSESDMSPPRRQDIQESNTIQKSNYRRNSSHRIEKNRKYSRFDSDSDLSPERLNGKQDSSLDRIVRKTRNSDSDLSPPRKSNSTKCLEISPKGEMRRPVKTLSGLKAGLQNAQTLRKETQELRQRERKQINKLDSELSGRNAETIVRDRKTGKRRDLEEENREKEDEQRRLSEQQKKYSEWGKGIVQTESRKNKFSEDFYEMSKPLARHRDDEDLEEMLKTQLHAEDPMADYMAKKRRKEDGTSITLMPEYSGPPPPPNRFGLKPGYRWDGVDRSNGFEKKYFEKINKNKAVEEEAYLWSVQDM